MPTTLFEVIMLLMFALSTVLWVLVQYNVIRFVKRQDGFSEIKDDHEKRLTNVEVQMENKHHTDSKRDHDNNRTFDRLEGSVNEVRSDVKGLRETIYEYLLKVNSQMSNHDHTTTK